MRTHTALPLGGGPRGSGGGGYDGGNGNRSAAFNRGIVHWKFMFPGITPVILICSSISGGRRVAADK